MQHSTHVHIRFLFKAPTHRVCLLPHGMGAIIFLLLLASCGSTGQEGEHPVNCGAHGSEHDGHCHCDGGYLFDGATCVTPDQITHLCGQETDDQATEEEEQHGACRCPEDGSCPCDHGTLHTYETKEFCVPELHHE